MDSITVKRAVTLFAIVTDELKTQLSGEVNAAMEEVDRNVQQLETQSRRYMLELQRTNLQQAMALRQRVDEERQKHTAVRTELERQMNEVQSLEMGTEFRRGVLEGTVEIKVGDNLLQVLNGAEIVVKDGLVQEFRYGSGEAMMPASLPPAEMEEAF
ncbi:MAG: YlqD family protein [Armatimonadota bacterium]|nr:YlqD family protein [Armatimonadota bacterium]